MYLRGGYIDADRPQNHAFRRTASAVEFVFAQPKSSVAADPTCADCAPGCRGPAGSGHRRAVGHHASDGRALAEEISPTGSSRHPEGCSTPRPQEEDERQQDPDDCPKNDAGEAGQRHALEHANDGRRRRREPRHDWSHLEGAWPEASSDQNFQTVQR